MINYKRKKILYYSESTQHK